MKSIIYILLFLLCCLSSAQNEILFEEGNTFYSNGKYSEAIEKYEAIINKDQHSAEVYFNLGNAHYKLNHIAPSIYYYEMALQLDPKDKEIKNNLSFAKNMTIDDIETVPEIGISRFVRNAIKIFSFEIWAYLSVVFMILFVILFMTYYFSIQSGTKRFSLVSSLVSIILSLVLLVFAYKKESMDKKYNPAIVFSQESLVRTDPNLSGEEAFRLHEGTKVQVLDTVSDWTEIQLVDGKTGWIVSEDIKLLKKF
ncbi:MAG: tetratricopeptide repeat protein [Flavobacteriaceae bacterium]|nr:tetratricopeptide repeat protein [Bacteroidia bacterium]NNL15514.1 tetratricopeptide repeat protein [Flavobacteriaceae bacterium]